MSKEKREKVEKYFVCAYFGGKTYLSHGIALVRSSGATSCKKEVLMVGSWCGGPDFVVERGLPGDATGAPKLRLSDSVWDAVVRLKDAEAESPRIQAAARADFEEILGEKLVRRIHEAVLD